MGRGGQAAVKASPTIQGLEILDRDIAVSPMKGPQRWLRIPGLGVHDRVTVERLPASVAGNTELTIPDLYPDVAGHRETPLKQNAYGAPILEIDPDDRYFALASIEEGGLTQAAGRTPQRAIDAAVEGAIRYLHAPLKKRPGYREWKEARLRAASEPAVRRRRYRSALRLQKGRWLAIAPPQRGFVKVDLDDDPRCDDSDPGMGVTEHDWSLGPVKSLKSKPRSALSQDVAPRFFANKDAGETVFVVVRYSSDTNYDSYYESDCIELAGAFAEKEAADQYREQLGVFFSTERIEVEELPFEV